MLVGALAAIAGALLVGGAPADAQASLVDSEPTDGAEVSQPPTELVLTFDEEVGESNTVAVACEGNPFSGLGRPERSEDNLTLRVAVTEMMPAGRCTVAWDVSQPTGEPGTSGSFSFTVLNSSVTTPGATVPATAPESGGTDEGTGTSSGDDGEVIDAADVSDGPTWLGRVLSTFGLAVLFGSLVLIVAAWPEGPEYILAVRFLRSVWLLTLVGTLLFVVALSAAVQGESLGSGLDPSGWIDLLDAGWAGRAAVARLVLVVASLWVVLRPERVIDPTTQLPALAIPTLAVVTLGLERTGGDLAILGVIAGVAHALAMAVWIGGVVLLARVVLAGPGEEDLVHAVRGFGRLSGPAIVITVISGLVQLYRLDGGSLFSEPHGRVLLLKTVLVAAMLFVGLTARQVVQARLARAGDLAAPMADRLRRAFGTEAVIGVLVIALSGWLLGLAPGKLPDSDDVSFELEEVFVDEASGIELTVALDPVRVGVNRLRVEVREPESGLTGLEVSFIPPDGSNEGTIVQTIPLTGAGIADSGEDGGVPFSIPGAWRMQVNATTQQGPFTSTTNFDVADADGNVPVSNIDSTPQPANTATTAPPTVAPATTAAGG